jgi:AAA domain (dynein-related subfamily)
MRYVVRCEDLQELKRQWDAIISQHRQQLPDARFVQTQPEFQQLVQHVAQHSRIQWFYYSENANGIALRLYDRAFKDAYSQHFRELEKEDGEEWVILRGHDLGSPRDPCKQAMRDAFGKNCWPVRQAPTNDPGNLSETLNLGTNANDRIAYFEHPYRNNAPGAVMRPDAPETKPRQDSLTMATELLQQFRQIILYGPPGTGKTRLARCTALALLAAAGRIPVPLGFDAGKLTEDEVQRRLSDLAQQGAFDLVVFHPAYEYEQFMGGIAPEARAEGLCYKIEPGVFLKMARWAEQNKCPAVLIIDEINRGNLPKLLGELLYALEYRDAKVRLPFEWQQRSDLMVPKDLYIIGTMNSSDRSIGHIDVAVRRRFGLLHIEPDPELVRTFWRDKDSILGDQLASLMDRLNRNLDQKDPGGELRVGHAYFLADPSLSNLKKQVERKWAHQVQQLLEEYGQLLDLDDGFFRLFPKKLDDALSA